ncbi:hypothetical protein RclHR1_10860005 [Rhizophagus clarus]|uniref:BTB domain-containing protein n=1 Tax=Rhizophagus clarus TaxID=94130 RepID=A0A2Z6Q480_9GLOM|nr:hypothetical protein RclHR1_10860005 [Rhizophagus clarus]GES91082.1 hypothetical protein GLOIN_2v1868401 [Rhizophagus clarus]
MTTQFFSKLSQDYIELLNDNEYYDAIIEVDNVKIRLHKNILCWRSPYLRQVFTSNKNQNNIKLQNISLEIFQIILRYIYGGILSLNERDASDILKILLAAEELLLQELVEHLQNYLIESESEWLEQHFVLIHRTSLQTDSLIKLQKFCMDFMEKSPEKIFKSLDFTSLSDRLLIQFIRKDDLQMKEIEIWEHLLKWGLAQNQNKTRKLKQDPNTWSDDDFKTMKNILQHFLPSIRFFSLTSKEFSNKVKPYKRLLNYQLYEDLVDSYINPDTKPNKNILPPRNIRLDKIINSKIINLNIISTISRWIDKVDVNNNFSHLRELYIPYKFELLLRGSRDGFTPKKFHELCDGKPNTITFIKVEGTEEILGGYNPLKWYSYSGWVKTKDNFIFSFDSKNIKNPIISSIEKTDEALFCGHKNGPDLADIIITSSSEFTDYDKKYYEKRHYEKRIRDIDGDFSIEDYEVFQIISRK